MLLLAAACSSDLAVPGQPEAPPPLALTVDEPAYGAYVGDRAVVSGSVNDPGAAVWIEGYRANVGSDGSFHVEVPVTGDFRVIDVEAVRPAEHLRERRPVFAGADPLASWPGGLTLRVTPVALDHVAELVAAQVDALDLPGTLQGALPSFAIGTLTVSPTGVHAGTPTVTVVPSPEGIALTVRLGALTTDWDVVTGLLGTVPVQLGLDEITLGATATVGVDADGALTVGVSGTDVVLGDPILVVDGLSVDALESLADGLTGAVGDAASGILDLGALLLGDFAVPIGSIDASSLGIPLTFALDGVGTDDDGVGASVAVDLGVPATGATAIPTLAQAGPQADLAVAVHEGLLAGLLDSDLLSTLDLGSIELPGVLGEIVALPISALPGGTQLPTDRTGMCLTVDPGDARTARLKDGTAPFAVLTLPDVRVGVAVSTTDRHCSPWIDASLAVQVALDLDGTALTPRIDVVDGAVLSYAAEGEFDEDEIVGGLGALVDVAIGLVGSSLSIDLADALIGLDGTALGDLEPSVLDVDPLYDADGQRVPGLEIVQLSLWD